MGEIRCQGCVRFLAKIDKEGNVIFKIKCPRCGFLNIAGVKKVYDLKR